MRPDGHSVLDVLEDGELDVVGRIADASNLALLVRVGATGVNAIYKPVSGERPLWDFPEGTLAAREVGAYLVSAAAGWDIVPETVLRDGPYGPGSVQRWVGDPDVEPVHPVDVVAPEAVAPGWLPVLRGEGVDGRPLLVVHEDSAAMRAVAVFDAVVNNSDRKGSHLVRERGELRGFDHGVCLHEDDKLRTVVWGFAGERIPEEELARVASVHAQVTDGTSDLRAALEPLVTPAELAALEARCRALLDHPAYPVPSGQWPAIPWPPL